MPAALRRSSTSPARGEGDVEERRSAAGIVVEQLVEIAHAVEEQHVRVLTLDAQVLLHHRRMRRAERVVHGARRRSEEHTSELQSQSNLVCRLLLEKKKNL